MLDLGGSKVSWKGNHSHEKHVMWTHLHLHEASFNAQTCLTERI